MKLRGAGKRRARRQWRPASAVVTIALDRDVLERFRATGPGWQSRINEALARVAP